MKKRVDGKYTLEVGGKNKTFKQIKNIKDTFVVRDDLGFGTKEVIPLWMFGLLY